MALVHGGWPDLVEDFNDRVANLITQTPRKALLQIHGVK